MSAWVADGETSGLYIFGLAVFTNMVIAMLYKVPETHQSATPRVPATAARPSPLEGIAIRNGRSCYCPLFEAVAAEAHRTVHRPNSPALCLSL